MENLSDNYRQYQAEKAYSPRPAKPGRINARPRNIVRDPITGARIGVTRRDGSFVPMGPEMGRPTRGSPETTRPPRLIMQSRADRVAAAMKDGTFQQKRDAYNRASKNYMDEHGNIQERPDPTPKITRDLEGNKKLESPYGTGSTQPGASKLTVNPPVGQAPALKEEKPKVPVQYSQDSPGLRDFGKGLELPGNSRLPTVASSSADMFSAPRTVSVMPQSAVVGQGQPQGQGQAQTQPAVATTPPPNKPERNPKAGDPLGRPRRK